MWENHHTVLENSPARAKMRLFSVVFKLSVIYNWEKLEFFKITGEQFRIRVCEVSFPSSRRLVFCAGKFLLISQAIIDC